ncbi:MAG: biopolymer transporter ExbD, partial [Planctomycetaceae bacterium]|nr:biopolymer transporter ExbD [Planctomycetaceae bacterium]
FLLIIFFMVGTRFTEIEQQYDISLPTAAPVESMSRGPDPLIINVGRDGKITMNSRALTPQELKGQLVTAREIYPEQAVLIRGDGEGMYQMIFDVMDICHQAEIRHFSLAFQPKASESAGQSGNP